MDTSQLIYELSKVIVSAQKGGSEALRPLLYDYETQIGKGANPSEACRDVVIPNTVEHWRRYLTSKFITGDIKEQRTKYHKFSDEEVYEILWDRYVNRMTHDFLVDKYNDGSGRQTIIDIVKRRRYTWVPVDDIVKVTGISEEAMKSKRFNF